jgi:hypothetical protein
MILSLLAVSTAFALELQTGAGGAQNFDAPLILKRAGVTHRVQGWDALKRDLLIRRVQSQTFKSVKKRYPQFTDDELLRIYQETLRGRPIL